MLGSDEPFELMSRTWEDAGDVIDEADLVALPCGSIEQHSHHLPISVDTLRADHLTRELAAAAPDHGLSIATLPVLPYGHSEHHMNFPGTVTLSVDTYREAIVEIGTSMAAHGAGRFMAVNCHGGNREPLSLAADRLQRDHDLPTHVVNWTDYAREQLEERFGDDWGHAGQHETSVIELLYPGLVKSEAKKPQTTTDRPETRPYRYFDDVTEEGGLGDPTDSDPEFVEGVVEDATGDILEALREDIEAEGSG